MSRINVPPEIVIQGTFDVLPDTPNPEFAVPREYARLPYELYGLTRDGVRIIDPMAGDGGTLAAALAAGVKRVPDAIELDEGNFDRVVERVPPNSGAEIIHGDCMKVVPDQMNRGYDAVIVSHPFRWLKDLVNHPNLRENFAFTLTNMVRDRASGGKPGLLFVDSAIRARRDGEELYPAYDTVRCLTERYFDLRAVHRLVIEDDPGPPEGCDTDFAWLVFEKRWRPYPGWVGDLYNGAVNVGEVNRALHQEAVRALAVVSFDGFNKSSDIGAVGSGY